MSLQFPRGLWNARALGFFAGSLGLFYVSGATTLPILGASNSHWPMPDLTERSLARRGLPFQSVRSLLNREEVRLAPHPLDSTNQSQFSIPDPRPDGAALFSFSLESGGWVKVMRILVGADTLGRDHLPTRFPYCLGPTPASTPKSGPPTAVLAGRWGSLRDGCAPGAFVLLSLPPLRSWEAEEEQSSE